MAMARTNGIVRAARAYEGLIVPGQKIVVEASLIGQHDTGLVVFRGEIRERTDGKAAPADVDALPLRRR